jgi:radical SAM protein with 4Fe4S-binding SPASM domain
MGYKVSEYPKNISFCFTEGFCNLRCPMCQTFGDRKKYHKNGRKLIKGVMDLKKAEILLQELKGKDVVIAPSGQIEFFTQKNYMEHLKLLKKYSLTVNINTNGLLLTPDMAPFLVQMIDGIYISIDAFTPETLERVRGTRELNSIICNIAALLKARGNHSYPRIGVSFVKQRVNKFEILDFVEYWLQYVDSVRVAELHARGEDIQWKLIPKKRKPCPMLYQNMYIHSNGNVAVCCWDAYGRTNLGNVFKQGVKGVWHGKEFQRLRRLHETGQWKKIPFCTACQDWPRYIYTEEIQRGNLLIRKTPLMIYYNRIDRLETWRFKKGVTNGS